MSSRDVGLRGCEIEEIMHLLSLPPLTVRDATIVEQIEAASAAQMQAIGLRLAKPALGAQAPFSLADDPPLRREIKAALSANGVGVLDIDMFRLQPQTDVTQADKHLALGAELGARFVLVTEDDPDFSRVAANFAALAERAETYGMRPMFEFLSYRHMRSLQDASLLLQAVNAPCAGICVDAFMLSRSHGHPRELRGLDPALFGYMHFCDAELADNATPTDEAMEREAVTERQYPGDGRLWLDELLDALPAGIPLSVEIVTRTTATLPARERARRAAQSTRSFLERRAAVSRATAASGR